MSHKLLSLNFTSVVSEGWESLPNLEKLKRQIATAVLAHSELTQEDLGMYAPPKEIREVRVTAAAGDQITCMWHGHRNRGRKAPPTIPLKIFVFGFGQDSDGTWADIEVFPGIDDWSVE